MCPADRARALTTRLRRAQDPFVHLALSPSEWAGETAVAAAAGSRATWRQGFSIPLTWHPRSHTAPLLMLAVRSKGAFGGSTLGVHEVDLSPFALCPLQAADMWVPLAGAVGAAGDKVHRGTLSQEQAQQRVLEVEGERGEVRLAVQYVPEGDHDATEPFHPRAMARLAVPTPSGARVRMCAHSCTRLRAADQPPLPAPRAGKVHVHVMAARRLRDTERVGTQDPYVTVTLRPTDVTARTQCKVDAGCEARWDESLVLDYIAPPTSGDTTSLPAPAADAPAWLAAGGGATPVLAVLVMNANLARDDVIGRVEVPLFPHVVHDGHVMQQWLPLRYKKGFAGEIQLSVQFIPHTPRAVAPPPAAARVQGDVTLHVQVLEGRGLTKATEMAARGAVVAAEVAGLAVRQEVRARACSSCCSR